MRRSSLFLFNHLGLAQVVFPFLFLFLTCASGVSAQTPIANLKQDFESYSTLMNSQEFDTAMNYVVPEFFEITPRSKFVGLMKMTNQLASNMGIETHGYSIIAIDSIVQIDSQFYSILHLTNQMTIPYIEGEAGESAKAKAKRVKGMIQAYEGKFGKGNVHFNPDSDQFEINAQAKVCCVSRDGLSNWKFVTLKPSQKMLLSKVLPEQILKKI